MWLRDIPRRMRWCIVLYSYLWRCNQSTLCEHGVIIDSYRSPSYQQSGLCLSHTHTHTLTKTHTPTLRQCHLSCSYRAENRSSTMTHDWLNMKSSLLSLNIPLILTLPWGRWRFFSFTAASPCGSVWVHRCVQECLCMWERQGIMNPETRQNSGKAARPCCSLSEFAVYDDFHCCISQHEGISCLTTEYFSVKITFL